jgi:nitrogen fixation protein NifM
MSKETDMNTAYLVLKTANSLYGKGPAALSTAERDQAERLAARQIDLEARVLASPEAAGVAVPEATVQAALAEVRGRYADAAEMAVDLAGNGLDGEAFAAALARELRVEAVLDKVGARAARVSDIDVELYYHYHLDQFERPETRVARHILVTVNEDLLDNGQSVARARIEAIAARLAKDPSRFEEQAIKHSECPTALSGGLLGEAPAGQLFPELDAALFQLEPMALSGVLSSPLGFHLVRCDAIRPGGPVALDLVKEKIRERLTENRRQTCIRAWLKTLS